MKDEEWGVALRLYLPALASTCSVAWTAGMPCNSMVRVSMAA